MGINRTLVLLATAIAVSSSGAQPVFPAPPALVFVATLGGPNPALQGVALTGSGTGVLDWKLVGPGAPWLTVTPLKGRTPDSLAAAVNIAGLGVGVYSATVGVETVAPGSPTRNVAVVLVIYALPTRPAAAPAGLAEYEVELRFTGYSGLVDGYPDCLVNPRGSDVLVGRVAGVEPPDPDEDVVYTGTMTRVSLVDYCETRGKDGPGDDERVWCAATLSGTATMQVEIEVYGEAGRGAWVKADSVAGPRSHTVVGSCDAAETNEIRRDYPSGDSGGSPSGQPIEDDRSATKFFDGRFARLRVGYYPADPSSRSGGWSLRVVRKIR